MKTVRIYGMADNLVLPPVVPGTEHWLCNDPVMSYSRTWAEAQSVWTRWFNLHSIDHIKCLYFRGYAWWAGQTDSTKRIVLQEKDANIPLSEAFPKDDIIRFFETRYFTFTTAWLIALAIYEGFERIELLGFRLDPRNPRYARQRPCFFYWVEEARRWGCEVIIPEDVGWEAPGNALDYPGELYGYETRCEFPKCLPCRGKPFVSTASLTEWNERRQSLKAPKSGASTVPSPSATNDGKRSGSGHDGSISIPSVISRRVTPGVWRILHEKMVPGPSTYKKRTRVYPGRDDSRSKRS
jgi:hypothetical protein